jgi:hypothetical protein
VSTEAWYVPLLTSIPSALIGAAVVYYFGLRQRAKERHFSFLERQLTEFYAPLAGLRRQIRTRSELRAKIQGLFQSDDEGQLEAFEATIEYHNKQFQEELLPKYRQMLALFTDRYHLASADTRAFYPIFLEFVEIWNLALAQSLPADVLHRLEHSEEKVKPFYKYLEDKMQQLQDEISRG